MLVKMKRAEKGSIDGIDVRLFKEGEIVDIPATLAKVFIDALECAEPYMMEEKSIEGAPHNKEIIILDDDEKDDEKEDNKKGKKSKKKTKY